MNNINNEMNQHIQNNDINNEFTFDYQQYQMNEINLSEHVNNQIYNFFNLKVDVSPFIEVSLDRTLKCFQKNQNKYYQDLDNIYIFHSGQYSIFLYYLSNTIYKSDVADNLADLIYYLNKVLHSVDWFYAIELPGYWGVEHPLGMF